MNTQLALSVNAPVVAIQNDKAVTTSLAVAEYFGKRHSHVLEKIHFLDCSKDFASANFSVDVKLTDIGNSAKRESKIYQMTKDGFTFLAMGFTGKKTTRQVDSPLSGVVGWAQVLNTPQLADNRTRQTCGFFMSIDYGRVASSTYNTRKGKTAGRLTAVFKYPAALLNTGYLLNTVRT